MLISSGNTLTDAPRNNVQPDIWVSHHQMKLTYKINQHIREFNKIHFIFVCNHDFAHSLCDFKESRICCISTLMLIPKPYHFQLRYYFTESFFEILLNIIRIVLNIWNLSRVIDRCLSSLNLVYLPNQFNLVFIVKFLQFQRINPFGATKMGRLLSDVLAFNVEKLSSNFHHFYFGFVTSSL